MAIGDVEEKIGVLDILLEKRPPFISIENVVEEFCAVLKEYNIYECVGDRYAAGFTVEAFRKHGVEYRHSDMTTSDYFSGFLPILNSRRTLRSTSALCVASSPNGADRAILPTVYAAGSTKAVLSR